MKPYELLVVDRSCSYLFLSVFAFFVLFARDSLGFIILLQLLHLAIDVIFAAFPCRAGPDHRSPNKLVAGLTRPTSITNPNINSRILTSSLVCSPPSGIMYSNFGAQFPTVELLDIYDVYILSLRILGKMTWGKVAKLTNFENQIVATRNKPWCSEPANFSKGWPRPQREGNRDFSS